MPPALIRPVVATMALLMLSIQGTAVAQTAPSATANNAAKAAPKAAPKAATKAATKAAPQKPPPVTSAATLPPAPGEQMAAASMTHFGQYDCEFSQTIHIGLNPKHDGYIDVRFGKQAWTMKPVLSSTGALRLEDVRGRMLMLQIANKSMLMDTQAGRRVVDDCVHEKQQESNRANKASGETGKP